MLCFLLIGLVFGTSSLKVEDLTGGSATSLKFSMETPDFAGPIKNVTVPIGREAVLSCSVTDLGHYKVGWMKADDQTILSLHTRVITHNPRISVTHDDSLRTWQLRIRQLKESDRGCYMCQINTGEMKKQLGCVDVQVPPDIDDTGTSSDVTVEEGDNVTLSCSASGHPEPRILWRREDGDHIILQDNPHDIKKVDTYSGPSLRLVRIDRKQMGSYLCIASNDVPPAVSKRVTLSVNFAPKVQVQKALVGAPLYSNVKLKCDVEAFPNSNNYWVKEQDEVLLNGFKYTTQEKRSGYKVIMVLTIHNVNKSDIGTYTCVASNTMGKSDASVRIYEIKITTTSTTTTTTTTTPSTTTTETNLILEITSNVRSTTTLQSDNTIGGVRGVEEDPSENWLFPSVAPAPLELETHSSAAGNTLIFHFPVTLVLTVVLILR
ncbi:lachesin isoform X1 [Tribolium castaneum]|uniref:Lachesin-like Protein n=1 Tax=Tribolium castaneum TaxID=7070 RepID=D6WCY6_TRICA|nr:PREDICTED: lachesin isoform X1 [Tribolium castaneum]XP_015839038.1 PREDICTED: lachesin isoform X1 [Tribolium castaneum]EEZ99076.2 Lachesin-like Protein [Tribolium castaneum]|eukprot:XP_015839036.1 PREDICTED: lachesin isoform X1 [Tribolium castaneum]